MQGRVPLITCAQGHRKTFPVYIPGEPQNKCGYQPLKAVVEFTEDAEFTEWTIITVPLGGSGLDIDSIHANSTAAFHCFIDKP